MANKKRNKKMNTKVRRTIRKTSAAVLMIVAIAVAAIPADNLRADNGDGANPSGGKTTLTGLSYIDNRGNYAYDNIKDDRTNGVETETGVVEHDSESEDGTYYKDVNKDPLLAAYHRNPELLGVKTSKAVRTTMENGKPVYIVDWQFKYKGNYLYAYNNQFAIEELIVRSDVTTAFATIKLAEFKNYFETGDGSKEVAYGWNDWIDSGRVVDEKNATVKFLLTFFTDRWNVFIKSCEQEYARYEKDKAAYEAGEIDDKPLIINYGEDIIPCKGKPSDLNGEDQYRYFCNNTNSVAQYQKKKDTFTLQVAKEVDEKGENSQIYLLKVLNSENVSDGYSIDENGFLIESVAKMSIHYVGDYAFAGVDKVKRLELPKDIISIGDYAFYQSSLLEEIDLKNAEQIGNAAFKDCKSLYKVDFSGTPIKMIGSEAFAGTTLSTVKLPSTLKKVAPGAFRGCTKLSSVDFADISSASAGAVCEIGEAAFYDCNHLVNIAFGTENNIKSLGKACFGVSAGDDVACDIALPQYLEIIPDYLFVGRKHLRSVVFPVKTTTIPENVFVRCSNLESVTFPDELLDYFDSCNVSFKNKNIIFVDVTNKNFCVYGPGMVDGKKANPRMSTWGCFTMVNDFVPYVFIDDQGVINYEISDGIYILNANEKGELVSCDLKDANSTTPFDLVIPSKVGNYPITTLKEGCFGVWNDKTSSKYNMRQYIKKIVVSDGTISEIPDEMFKNLGRLKEVVLGESVVKVGKEAFAQCGNLVDVSFKNTDNVTLEDNAFATGGTQLTFHGEIRDGYGPFDWAMTDSNYVNGRVRVCYKQTAPSCLTVILDDTVSPAVPTLVDYPKYQELDDVYGQYAIEDIYETYSYSKYDEYRDDFILMWRKACNSETTGITKEDIYQNKENALPRDELGNIKMDEYGNDRLIYGPWVNELFCMEVANEPLVLNSSARTSESYLEQLAEVYKPLVVNAAEDTLDKPTPYFSHPLYKDYSIIRKIENAQTESEALKPWEKDLTYNELQWVNACMNIVVPSGVKSIDAYRYYTASDGTGTLANRPSIAAYFGNMDPAVIKMYKDTTDREVTPGLFSGFYSDYKSSDSEKDTWEKKDKGNDRIESIVLTDVEYLPDYAFDSCERLKKVVLGNALEDIGTLPFRDCFQLNSVEGNEKYYVTSGLLIDTTPNVTGGSTIIECIPGRGTAVGGNPLVPDATNPSEADALSKVSLVEPEAFKDCVGIKQVDLSSTKIKQIPEDTFENCSSLDTLKLPVTTNEILDGSCLTGSTADNTYFHVYIPGGEVQIKDDAFDHNQYVCFHTPKDTAAYTYAVEHGITTETENVYKVEFWDYDYTSLLADPIYVKVTEDENGNPRPVFALAPDDPTDPNSKTHIYGDGKFSNEIPTRQGYEFKEWYSSNPNIEFPGPITGDVVFVARYTPVEGSHDGKWYVTVKDGVTGARIGEILEVDDKGDVTKLLPKVPEHDGYNFMKWSEPDEVLKEVQDNLVVIALYSPKTSPAPAPNPTPNPNPSKDDDNKNSNSNNNSSSNNSSSDNKKYKVTVENGSGSGEYLEGSTVAIAANTPAAGQVFSKWSTDSKGVSLTNAAMSATTFKMPANDVTVKAEYVASAAETTAVAPTTTTSYPPGYGDGYGTTTNQKPAEENTNAQVSVSKPGVSNIDLATARVNGSSDSFVIKVTETNGAEEAVRNALTNRYGSLDNRIEYWACDISLYDETGNTKITDTTGLTVDITLPIPDSLRSYGGNNMVGAVADGSLESLTPRFNEINGVPCVTFTATHFSPYTIYVDKDNLVASQMMDATPKTGDPIHPKWFLSIGLACVSILLFMKKDKRTKGTLKTA